MLSGVSRDIALEYWQGYVDRDFETLARLRSRGWFCDYPQSGERIPSHKNDRLIHENYPGYPEHFLTRVGGDRERDWTLSPSGPIRIFGNLNLWFVEGVLEYPTEGRYHLIGILELRDNRVLRETDYFARPFEAPGWRQPWTAQVGAEDDSISGDVGGSGSTESHTELLNRYVEEFARGNVIPMLREIADEKFVAQWPQSGERIRGVENYTSIIENHPAGPVLKSKRRVVGSTNLSILEVLLEEGGEPWHEVSIFEFRGDKVLRKTDYFAQPFDPPDWRAELVVRI